MIVTVSCFVTHGAFAEARTDPVLGLGICV